MLTLGSKTIMVETSFVGVDLLKVFGHCGSHDAYDDYLGLFAEVEGEGVGHTGFILNVASCDNYLDEVVQVGGFGEKE